MGKSYLIQWKSKVNGRAGRGNKVFSREDAERLAAELNQEYPDIEHEPVPVETPAPPALVGAEARSSGEHAQNEADEPAPSLSSR